MSPNIYWNGGGPLMVNGLVGGSEKCCCQACSEECCRTRVYSYYDTVPPGKWYTECPRVGNCATGDGAIFGDCAGEVIEGHIVERFCKASIEGLDIRAILRDGSTLDNFGTIAGIDTSESCDAVGKIAGDHDITPEIEFEDSGTYILAKVPIRVENGQTGGPVGAANVVICWCCVDPADPPPEGEVCPCCSDSPPPPPPFCEPCSSVDIDPPDGFYTNERVDPCRGSTYSDYTAPCRAAGFSYVVTGSYIRSLYPDLGLSEEIDNCDILWLYTSCTTIDFATGQDANSNCCVVSRGTTIVRNYFYRWVDEDCLWRLLSQNKEVESILAGDPLAVGGCDAEFPAARTCTESCDQSQTAEACCNPLP